MGGPATLFVDLDGDGAAETKIVGHSVASKPARLKFTGPNKAIHHLLLGSVEFEGRGPFSWRWHPETALRTTVLGEELRLVDADFNGRLDFNDALLFGPVRMEVPRVLVVGGQPWQLEVAPDRSTVTLKPFAGACGKVDLVAGKRSPAEVRWLTVRNRHCSAVVTAQTGPINLPAGNYSFTGKLALAGKPVEVACDGGLEIEAGKTCIPQWGDSLTLVIDPKLNDNKIDLLAKEWTVRDSLGERWTVTAPAGTTGQLEVFAAGKRQKLASTSVKLGCFT